MKNSMYFVGNFKILGYLSVQNEKINEKWCQNFSSFEFKNWDFLKKPKWTEMKNFWHFLRYLKLVYQYIADSKLQNRHFSQRKWNFFEKCTNFHKFWRIRRKNYKRRGYDFDVRAKVKNLWYLFGLPDCKYEWIENILLFQKHDPAHLFVRSCLKIWAIFNGLE